MPSPSRQSSARARPLAGSLVEPPARAEQPPPIATSHLASDDRAAALTRLELAMMRAYEALSSSALEIHKNVGGPSVSWQDVALLHSVRLRGGTPTLTEMLVFLHRYDLAALQYSFKKLESLGLVRKVRGPSRRERAYAITEAGQELTDAHSRMRSEVTVALSSDIVDIDDGLHEAAAVLERLVGMYDQATATVLNGRVLRDAARHGTRSTRGNGRDDAARGSPVRG